MSVYVDSMKIPFRGMIVCHMTADTTEELHNMAQRIGLKKEWLQPKSRPHYDISKSKRELAVGLGAIEVTGRRTPKRIKTNC